MPEGLRVQIAFQGGGAKIAALLAAAEAIYDLHQEGRIVVTRLAGTSAGAITACLLARAIKASASLSYVRNELVARGQKEIDRLFPRRSWWGVLRRLLSGKPTHSAENLRELLGQLFNNEGFTVFRDLGLPVFVTAADLLNGRKVVFGKPDDVIVDALESSCALPFAFRTWKNVGHPAIVDGGICENLPSDELREGAGELGDIVIGISFQKRGLPKRPESVKEFALSLLSTAIDNSVERARLSLGEGRVHAIGTSLDTFDFHEVVSKGLGEDHYGRVKLEALSWFERILAVVPEVEKGREPPGQRILLGDPWNLEQESASSRERMADLHRVYLRQHHHSRYRVLLSAMVVTAHSLKTPADEEPEEPDLIKQIVEIAPTSDPVHAYRFSLASLHTTTFQGRSSWLVQDQDGNPVEAIGLPVVAELGMVDSAGSRVKAARHLLLYFLPPLLHAPGPDKYYTSTTQTLMADSMRPLRIEGHDTNAITNTRPEDVTERCDLVLFVPEGFGEIEQSPGSVSGVPPGRSMTARELARYGPPPPGFSKVIGWTGENIQPGTRFGVVLRRRP